MKTVKNKIAVMCASFGIVASVFAGSDLGGIANAPWIGDGRPLPEGEAWYGDRPAPQFRAYFSLSQGATSAVLRVAAAGYYDVRVNGRRLADVSLMPLWSPFDITIYADSYRLGGEAVRQFPGKNEITVAMGNGFYNLPPLAFWGRFIFRNALASGSPVFKIDIDGAPVSGWEWRETGILRNCVYLGAHIDATRSPGEWRKAVECAGPRGRIVPRKAPPVSVYGTLSGRSRWLRRGEVQVVDFGVNGTGVPSFLLHGRRGQRVEFLYGEKLNPDGSVNVLTQTAGQIKKPGKGGPGAPDVAAQRDVFVCSGEAGGDRFEPPFTWHVCRYAEVRGLDRLIGDGEADLRLVSSAVADAAPGTGFASGDPDLDRIHEICRRTFRSNIVGVQSDCPGRERLGYGADIVPSCNAFMLNYDMREFYLKTLQDFADEAAEDGWITETAPYVGIHDRGLHGRGGPISWSLVVPVLIDGLLRNYGDERGLAFYPVCARYARLVDAEYPDGNLPPCIGDHEALERAPDEMVSMAHWHEFLRLTSDFARRLGRGGEAAEFDMVAAKVGKAFAAKWVGGDGKVANGTQSAQSIALYLGLVPDALREAAVARLVEAVEEKGCAPYTGIFSTRYMLMFLSENGRADLARKVVLHRGFPGWLHMIERGGTTLWETWKESDDSYSSCHPMFGSVDEWIVKYGRQGVSGNKQTR